MRSILLHFTDAEYNKLVKARMKTTYGTSWNRFILYKCSNGVSIKKELK